MNLTSIGIHGFYVKCQKFFHNYLLYLINRYKLGGIQLRFYTKIDIWVHVACLCICYQTIVFTWFLITQDTSNLWVGLGTAVGWILSILLVLPFYVLSYSEIKKDTLVLRLGFLKQAEIPYECILKVAPTTKAFFSFALSYDRLELVCLTPEHGKQTLLISPKNKEEFIRQLQKKNPKIDTNCPGSGLTVESKS
ncbi:MAG: hypothetical protein DBX37_04465 [Massilioclostridium sp.]|nr:MAG: hypothetical protein DBX37_04465 [Massilioclostridium sp.]